jgi:hypothetical protein
VPWNITPTRTAEKTVGRKGFFLLTTVNHISVRLNQIGLLIT